MENVEKDNRNIRGRIVGGGGDLKPESVYNGINTTITTVEPL